MTPTLTQVPHQLARRRHRRLQRRRPGRHPLAQRRRHRSTDWLGQANGGFADNDANAFASVRTDWHVAGTGDFNGDGRDDILWRNDNGDDRPTGWAGQRRLRCNWNVFFSYPGIGTVRGGNLPVKVEEAGPEGGPSEPSCHGKEDRGSVRTAAALLGWRTAAESVWTG